MRFNRLLIPSCLVLLIGISPILLTVAGTTTLDEENTIWETLEHEYPNGIFHDIAFLNATYGWVVGQWNSGTSGDGIILHTTDGGMTWQTQLQSPIFEEEYQQIDIIDADSVWVTTNGGLLHTTNFGENWTEHSIIESRMMMRVVEFIDTHHGWTATNNTLYRTTDGGETWTTVSGWTFDDHPRHMQFVSSTEVWAIGYFGIYHSTNGARSWNQKFSKGGWSLSIQADGEGWAVSDSSIMHTIDGTEWTELSVPSRTPFGRIDPPYLTDVLFMDDIGWIVGTEIPVMCTPDGGTTWYEQSIREGFHDRLLAVDFLNQTYGWAVGYGGNILRTTKGNSHGSRLLNGLTDPVFLSMAGALAATVVIVSGVLIRHQRRKATRRSSNLISESPNIE